MVKNITPNEAGLLVNTIKEINDSWTNYLNTKEIENTKRVAITARKEMVIEDIRARRDVLMHSIDKAYEERSVIIGKYLETIERGIQDDNINLVSLSIAGLMDAAKHQPGSSIKELQEVLDRSNYTLELE